jgi:hypothetical protein
MPSAAPKSISTSRGSMRNGSPAARAAGSALSRARLSGEATIAESPAVGAHSASIAACRRPWEVSTTSDDPAYRCSACHSVSP